MTSVEHSHPELTATIEGFSGKESPLERYEKIRRNAKALIRTDEAWKALPEDTKEPILKERKENELKVKRLRQRASDEAIAFMRSQGYDWEYVDF